MTRCEDCRFYAPIQQAESGTCRFNPPVIDVAKYDRARPIDDQWESSLWPVVFCEWWCGKAEPREVQP